MMRLSKKRKQDIWNAILKPEYSNPLFAKRRYDQVIKILETSVAPKKPKKIEGDAHLQGRLFYE